MNEDLILYFYVYWKKKQHTGQSVNKSFKSLFHNTIGKNASKYTVNKVTYIHSLYINKYNEI